ncbi:Inositol phosphatase SIW14 [Polyrhizophydium stewartii]|uniref:Inositol phosphatase SIW14 n=1 Tax=Polyrhizophydium stewartii TaxID=2732419 RepID=A0ABR4MY84_9FUNG
MCFELGALFGTGRIAHIESSPLTRAEFETAMRRRLERAPIDETIRQMFVDIDAQCRGYVDEGDFRRMFARVLPRMPPERASILFRNLSPSGKMTYRLFRELMTENSLGLRGLGGGDDMSSLAHAMGHDMPAFAH